MARYRRRRTGLWGRLILVAVLCILAGAALAWINDKGYLRRDGSSLAAESGEISRDDLARLSRAELERKVRDLTRDLELKDKQIGDLMIENKILSAGSRPTP